MNASSRGEVMKYLRRGILAATIPFLFGVLPSQAQDSSIFVQCPETTDLHPTGEGIKCLHLSGGDGMATMADGKELYVFSFAKIPLPADSGVSDADYPGFAMETGMLAATTPAPTIVVDEDDELFLTLTNVGMAIRPDLFDPHTVHWHGFPQAASIFDGVPDASVSINMGASLTYYYQAKDAGTYMYHCHVEATEHMQMGMLGNLYVRPRQDRLPATTFPSGFVHVPWDATAETGNRYAYNDGDGSTYYDVDYPIQLGSFDPVFHDASFEVQPLPFGDMQDRYFMINGRGYPDTVDPGIIQTADPLDGHLRDTQEVSSLITADPDQRILLRISNLNVTTFNTIATNGPPMQVVGRDARLLRDDDGNNMYYNTNSLTLGGGQSVDVIVDTSGLSSGQVFFLYTTNLDRLANDAENFGGMMTEIRIN